jgi:hypothetical protein
MSPEPLPTRSSPDTTEPALTATDVVGAAVTVKVNGYLGDGTYYLSDPAHELDGLREGPPGRVLRGARRAAPSALAAMLADGPFASQRAFDVIVAAPKTVSLLLALESAPVAARVVACHERSVEAALDYVLDEALDRGSDPPSVVAFTHGVNRQLDPHLHTHVLVAPTTAEGASIPAGALRAHGAAADALYLAALRGGVRAASGRAAWRSDSGRTYVEGIDVTLVAEASTPRDRIGRLDRSAAKSHPSRDEVQRRWEPLRRPPIAVPPLASATIDEIRFARELGDGSVRRRDVVRAWAAACPDGAEAPEVLAAVDLVASGLGERHGVPAVTIRDPSAVRVLGPRPMDRASLGRWREDRALLERYLEAGHRLEHLVDPRGAPAATLLAVASFDAARSIRRRTDERARDRDDDRRRGRAEPTLDSL